RRPRTRHAEAEAPRWDHDRRVDLARLVPAEALGEEALLRDPERAELAGDGLDHRRRAGDEVRVRAQTSVEVVVEKVGADPPRLAVPVRVLRHRRAEPEAGDSPLQLLQLVEECR